MPAAHPPLLLPPMYTRLPNNRCGQLGAVLPPLVYDSRANGSHPFGGGRLASPHRHFVYTLLTFTSNLSPQSVPEMHLQTNTMRVVV